MADIHPGKITLACLSRKSRTTSSDPSTDLEHYQHLLNNTTIHSHQLHMASTTPLAAPAMLPGSTITVLLQRPIDAERRLLTAAIPRSNLVAHSGGFRRFLSGWPVEDELHRAVTLPEGSPGGLKHVLGIIRMHGHEEDLFINIGGMGLPRTIAIWEACEIIDIEPKSALEKLTAHICYRVSHEKVTPEVMDRVQRVFSPALAPGNAERRRPWDSLVAQ